MQEHETTGSAESRLGGNGPAASETRRCNALVVWGGRARCHNHLTSSLARSLWVSRLKLGSRAVKRVVRCYSSGVNALEFNCRLPQSKINPLPICLRARVVGGGNKAQQADTSKDRGSRTSEWPDSLLGGHGPDDPSLGRDNLSEVTKDLTLQAHET